MDNAVLVCLPKRLIVTMVKNTDFLGNMPTNPFYFHHYDLNHFALYVNGKQIPPEGLSLDMSREKTAIMGYRNLFEGSGIHYSNTGLQKTPVKYINGYFILVFDLTPDIAASEGHTSDPAHGNIRLELKFAKALPDPLVRLLYLEFDDSVLIDAMRLVSTDSRWTPCRLFVLSKTFQLFVAYTRLICYLGLYAKQALLLLMLILTLGKVHTGLQYILTPIVLSFLFRFIWARRLIH